MKAVRIERYGGPEVLEVADVPAPEAGPGEIVVRNAATGFQFLETRMRRGDYPQPLPGGMGTEGAGEIAALGAGVTGLTVGDRVAYLLRTPGAHAELAAVPADRAVRLPDSVSFERAAQSLLKGMTARMLLKSATAVQPGDAILVWAAAGGMGQHLVQWGTALGARVIAVVGSPAKAAIPRALGAAEVLTLPYDQIAAEVRRLTGGAGVRVVYDAIGRDTATASFDSLGIRGLFANYGSASGVPDPIVVTDLSARGSLFYTRAVLQSYTGTAAEFAESAADVIDALDRGLIDLPPPTRYRLEDIRQLHIDMAARTTTGSQILIP